MFQSIEIGFVRIQLHFIFQRIRIYSSRHPTVRCRKERNRWLATRRLWYGRHHHLVTVATRVCWPRGLTLQALDSPYIWFSRHIWPFTDLVCQICYTKKKEKPMKMQPPSACSYESNPDSSPTLARCRSAVREATCGQSPGLRNKHWTLQF